MIDRELLEKAAKAAGIKIQRSRLDDPLWRDMLLNTRDPRHNGQGIGWNPLTDDGDALRLAVKLNLGVMAADRMQQTCTWQYCNGGRDTIQSWNDTDAYAATRRAIVRAAASIGETP